MRHVSGLLLFLGCLLAVSAGAAPKKTVVDYFNMAVKSGNVIVFKNGKWFLETTGNEVVPVPIVDIKNGYIKIEEEGKGWIEAALFLRKDGSPVLVVSGKNSENPCSLQDFVKVFELKDGAMAETGSMLPILPMDPFFKDGFNFDDKQKIGELANTVRITYRLPRKGTAIQVTLDMDCFERTTGKGDPAPEEKEQAKNFLESIKCKVIDITWDMDKGRFMVEDDKCK